MSRLSITWLGHSTFILTTPGGKRIVTDPWLEGNPTCPPDRRKIAAADLILVSHGHSDHTGDAVAVSRSTGAPIVAIYGLALWFERKGLPNLLGMGNEVDMHTPHWHGKTVEIGAPAVGRRTDVVELSPATMVTADMNADNVGEWMFHCHVSDHILAGMLTTYQIIDADD